MTTRLLFALLAILLISTVGQAQRLGFIDVEEVILKYDKTSQITRELEDSLKEREQTLRQRLDQINARKQQLDLLEGDSVEKLTQLKNIRQEEEELKIDQEYTLVSLEQRLAGHMKKVYEEVLELVAALASERKLTAVFMYQKKEISGTSRESVESSIVVRPVLWHEPSLDLTAEIIRRLNK